MEERYSRRAGIGQRGNTLVLLLAIIVIVFCVFTFIQLSFRLTGTDSAAANNSYYKGIFDWFRMPSNLETLLTRPWTIFTTNHLFHPTSVSNHPKVFI